MVGSLRLSFDSRSTVSRGVGLLVTCFQIDVCFLTCSTYGEVAGTSSRVLRLVMGAAVSCVGGWAIGRTGGFSVWTPQLAFRAL